jgi:hypothetical protein
MEMRFSNTDHLAASHELPFARRIATMGVSGIKSTDLEYREVLEHVSHRSDRTRLSGLGARLF